VSGTSPTNPDPPGSPSRVWRERADRLASLIERVLDAWVGLMILTMAAAICWQVFARYVLEAAPGWSEELARYLMIWVTMIGGATVLRSGGQMAVTSLLDRLPPIWQKRMLAARDITMVAALVLLIWWGAKLTNIMTVQETASLQVSKAWVYVALPLGAALMLVMLVLARLAGGAYRTADVFEDGIEHTT
jgi:TRAP-type C4-dicarboxylate transport system permease small subunit